MVIRILAYYDKTRKFLKNKSNKYLFKVKKIKNIKSKLIYFIIYYYNIIIQQTKSVKKAYNRVV